MTASPVKSFSPYSALRIPVTWWAAVVDFQRAWAAARQRPLAKTPLEDTWFPSIMTRTTPSPSVRAPSHFDSSDVGLSTGLTSSFCIGLKTLKKGNFGLDPTVLAWTDGSTLDYGHFCGPLAAIGCQSNTQTGAVSSSSKDASQAPSSLCMVIHISGTYNGQSLVGWWDDQDCTTVSLIHRSLTVSERSQWSALC